MQCETAELNETPLGQIALLKRGAFLFIKETPTLLGDFCVISRMKCLCVISRMKCLWVILFTLFSSFLFADDNGEDTSQTDQFSCEAAGNKILGNIKRNIL